MKLTFKPKNGIDGSASVGNFKDLLKPLSDDAKVSFEDGTMVIDDPSYNTPDDYIASLTDTGVNTEYDCENYQMSDCDNRTAAYNPETEHHIAPAPISYGHVPQNDFISHFTNQEIIDDNGIDRNKAIIGLNNEIVLHNQERENDPECTPEEISNMLPEVRYMNNIVANTIADYAFAAAKQLLEYNTQMVTNMVSEARIAGRREMCHVVDMAVEAVAEDYTQEIDTTRDMIKQQSISKKKRK